MINPDAVVIGVDVGATKIAAGVLKLQGEARPEIVAVAIVRPTNVDSAGALVDHVEGVARTAATQAGVELDDCSCVGIGFPGQVDRRTGVVTFLPGFGLKDIAAKATLERRLGRTVHVENDVRCTTLAELRYGAGLTYGDFVCVWVGTGIGSGIVIDRKVRSGYTHSAGELGHMKIDTSAAARRCMCGSYGCFEEYCSGRALSALARTMMRGTSAPEDIARLASNGDRVAIETAEQIAHYLGMGLASVANLLNPEAIVLGGGIIDGFFGFDFFRARLSDVFSEHALDVCRSTRIMASALSHAPIVGAASLATLSP